MSHITATVTRIVRETPSIRTICFTVGGHTLTYIAGQYVTVYFDHTGLLSGKAYSLSSSPRDTDMRITVKRVGLFSGLLCDLQPGMEFAISEPYGFFNAHADQPIVALAGGVGIAPLWSILRYHDTLPATLLYSNKTVSEIPLRAAIDAHQAAHDNFSVQYFITREAVERQAGIARRINLAHDIAPSDCSHMFYICGSVDFVTGMWQQLMALGVPDTHIATETFFET